MPARTTGREVRVGLVVLLAFGVLLGLFALAAGGPGFLSERRQIDVDFKDGQGIRAGNQVRIAGIDAGRVMAVSLAEVDGVLKARVRLAVPMDLGARLKQDARIAVQSTLTGQARINILSTGHSPDPLGPGKVLVGVETSMFDPVLEQVGMGPVERNNISHVIGEFRQTIDRITPKVRQTVDLLEQTVAGVKETSEAVRPVVEATMSSVGDAAKRFAGSTPKVEATLATVASLTARVDALLAENRPDIRSTVASIRDLAATVRMVVARDQEKIPGLLEQAKTVAGRADVAIYNAAKISEGVLTMLTRNKVDIERSAANVKDATEWGSKLVQKIYANPFVISPLYKPKPEDVRVQGIFDAMQVFSVGCEKLDDAAKTLEGLQGRPGTPQAAEEMAQIRRQVAEVTGKLGEMSTHLNDAMRAPAPVRARRGAPAAAN